MPETILTAEEECISESAFEYVRAHSKEVIARFAPEDSCIPAKNPISLFMAGSPGAGKTEVSQSFVSAFKDRPVRIDADEIRLMCPGYRGDNAHLFQKAANKGVNILYDHALGRGLNCILDGTFAYGNAPENIRRSLDRNRIVQIWFVYQDPIKAWEFTKVRELKEARHVSKEVFLRALQKSRENVLAIKNEFGSNVRLNLLVKDYEDGTEDFFLNIPTNELDRRTAGRYSIDELTRILI